MCIFDCFGAPKVLGEALPNDKDPLIDKKKHSPRGYPEESKIESFEGKKNVSGFKTPDRVSSQTSLPITPVSEEQKKFSRELRKQLSKTTVVGGDF